MTYDHKKSNEILRGIVAAGFLKGYSFGGVEHVTQANSYGVLLFLRLGCHFSYLSEVMI